MSRRPRAPRPAIAVVTLLLAALALGGCSAGTVTQTDTIVSGADGAVGHLGPIQIADVSLVAGPPQTVPAGAEVPLRATIVNQGATEDRLVSVSSPYATSVRQEGQTVIPAGNVIRIVGDEPGPVGAPNPDARQSGSMRLVLQGVTQQLYAGPTYPVTFTFEKAGTVTVPVILGNSEPVVG